MDYSSALPTFIITLREGVEAALVVGIVLAYLKKAGRTSAYRWVYAGIAVGILASASIGVFFSWLIQTLPAAGQKYAPAIEPLLYQFSKLMQELVGLCAPNPLIREA